MWGKMGNDNIHMSTSGESSSYTPAHPQIESC